MGANTDDFALLKGEHWIAWLGPDPPKSIRDAITNLLRKQDAGIRVDAIRVVGEPAHRCGGLAGLDGRPFTVTRAGIVVPIELLVRPSDGGGVCWRAVFTWVATGLASGERRDRVHVESEIDVRQATQALMVRIYEPDFGTGEELVKRLTESGESAISGPIPANALVGPAQIPDAPQKPWWRFW